MTIRGLTLAGFAAVAATSISADAADEELIETYCTACHSLAIVRQQRLSRSVWDDVLVWMVEEQGMPELEPDVRRAILDHLATAYAQDTPR